MGGSAGSRRSVAQLVEHRSPTGGRRFEPCPSCQLKAQRLADSHHVWGQPFATNVSRPRVRHKFIPSGFPVDFQLKGTSIASAKNGFITYDLNARNYDLVVSRATQATPFYLFLVCFHSGIDSWLMLEGERLILSASAYWWREASGPTKNATAVRLQIPTSSRLTTEAMLDLLDASKRRFVLQ